MLTFGKLCSDQTQLFKSFFPALVCLCRDFLKCFSLLLWKFCTVLQDMVWSASFPMVPFLIHLWMIFMVFFHNSNYQVTYGSHLVHLSYFWVPETQKRYNWLTFISWYSLCWVVAFDILCTISYWSMVFLCIGFMGKTQKIAPLSRRPMKFLLNQSITH